jgi:hypothetical protein
LGSGYGIYLNYYRGGPIQAINSSTSFYLAGTYYDNANTGYYVKPSSTSNFSTVIVNSGLNAYGGVYAASGWWTFSDFDRDPNDSNFYPNVNTRAVRFSFSNAGYTGTGGNYSGVMQFNPWSGTTASTGDASYQLGFGSTATNGGGGPQLVLRKGIDTTWNSWYYLPMYGLNQYAGTFFSTIYYDANNTGYYCQPSSTSNLSVVAVNGTLYTNYQYVTNATYGIMGDYAVNGTTNKCIWTIGTSWPLSNMYGLAYEYNTGYFGDHQITVKENGSTYTRLAMGGGIMTSGQLYVGGTFYDISSTSWYVKPSSLSQLAAVNAYQLCVNYGGAGNSGYGLSLYSTYGTFPQYGILFQWTSTMGTHGSVTADWATYFTMDTTANRGWVFKGGTVNSTSYNVASISNSGTAVFNGNVTAYSDIRIKKNIEVIDNAVNKVQQLRGVTFDRTDDERIGRQTGVIAQEVLKVLPEAVLGTEDTQYSVAYGNMVGLLIEAIKEQQGQIKALNTKVELLEEKLNNG